VTSLEYWKERERAAAEEYAVTDEQALARTREIYTRLVASIDERINAFYARYAASEGITMNLAEMAVSQFDVKAFEATAAKLVADRDFSAQANAQLKIYNATMRINRLEMLKAYIGLDLLEAGDDLVQLDERYLTERSRDEFERQAGILGESIRHTTDDVRAIVNSSFYNATFSQRIWANVSELQNGLSEIITNGIIQGINPRQMTGRLRERFAVSVSDAERLLRTELARVQTETQRQSFERMGFTAYVFISLEGRACPVCAALDTGEPILLEDFMPGETAPPIHPNCRCSTAAWMDREEMERELGFALDEVEEADDFTPAETIEEAVAFARQYIPESRWAGEGDVSFNGIGLEQANTFNRVLQRVSREYGENIIKGVQPMNLRKKPFLGTTSDAAYEWMHDNLYINPKYYKNSKTVGAHIKEGNDLLRQVLDNVDLLLARKSGTRQEPYLRALKTSGVQCVAQYFGAERYAEATFLHEFGHALHDNRFNALFKAKDFDLTGSMQQYGGQISGYAVSDTREYVAESFCSYMLGRRETLDPSLVSVFEEAKR